MSVESPADALDPSKLIACPACDALYTDRDVATGETARCLRCHAVLEAPRRTAMTRIIMLALAALILMVAAIFFPFLELEAAGRIQRASLLDTVQAFSSGLTAPLTFAMAALIVILPVIRFLALIYVLGPMAFGHRPARHAEFFFRLADHLRPWAMAEVFIVGVAVALVKVAGLAHIFIGPAFWAFVALVIVTVLKDNFMSRLTLWKTLERRPRILTAKEAGLVGCTECGRVHPPGVAHCSRCGSRLRSRDSASLQRVWAWLFAGLVVYVPANLYPMLRTTLLGKTTESTIFGGVVDLMHHGSYGVAAIVFIASIVIPVSKFIAIGYLALSVQRRVQMSAHRRHLLYEAVEFIGRWSMIDVFVVAILSSLVQLDFAASINPGIAAVSFALSVAFTMISALSFDSRLIWDADVGVNENE